MQFFIRVGIKLPIFGIFLSEFGIKLLINCIFFDNIF